MVEIWIKNYLVSFIYYIFTKLLQFFFSIVKVQEDSSKAAICPCYKNLCLDAYILQL